MTKAVRGKDVSGVMERQVSGLADFELRHETMNPTIQEGKLEGMFILMLI